jgi:hypothetical protein
MNFKEWITTNWFPLLICASLAFVGEWAIAILMFMVWELWRQRQEN